MLKQVQHDSEKAIDTASAFSYSKCMGFLKKAIDFVARPSHSRTLGIVMFFFLVAAVSLTVYVAQQQQQLRQRASSHQVCSDINSISECSTRDPSDNPCLPEGDKCKTGNTVYECKKQ